MRRQAVTRAAISLLLVVTLFCVVVQLLPGSSVQQRILEVVRPVLAAVGLEQAWGVFAPDPRPHTISMRVRITYTNGGTEWWDLPEGDPVLGQYWDFRWRKYLEYIVNPQYRTRLFRPFATWIARRLNEDGRRPTKVVFVARWRDLYTPVGDGPLQSPWRESAYYTLRVTDAVLGAAE